MGEYPKNWTEIANAVKAEHCGCCERCGHPNDRETGHVLTVHHIDGDKSNVERWNLAALCQRCHLAVQGRIKMRQMFMSEILPVSDWFKPHLEGYLKSKGSA